MSKITPVTTGLPFHKLPLTYVAGTTPETPFYFQKKQCVRDCFFGTITDRNHLPSFILRIKIPENPLLKIELSTPMDFEIQCADGTNVQTIVPDYRFTINGFVFSASDLVLIATQPTPPTIGDVYYYDDGILPVELYTWNGVGWNQSGQLVLFDGDLMNVTNEGFIYAWRKDDESTETNQARNGEWKKTLNGFQLSDIGDETYLIYNGFLIEDVPCGLQQIKVSFPTLPVTTETGFWLSELVDVRDFNPVNNKYHKLKFTNSCNLGNIPFSDLSFGQTYYFSEDTLVGEPDYETKNTKEEDGLGNEKLIFSRTSKVFQLDTLSVPEYIVDLFVFATQHDTVSITFPLEFSNKLTEFSQYQGEREIDNDSFDVESDWIATGCYAQVNLKFSLVDDIIDTACCQQLDKDACLISSFDIQRIVDASEQSLVESTPPSVGDCFLILSGVGVGGWFDHLNEIACFTVEGTWTYTEPTENIVVNILEVANSGLWLWTSVSIGWKKFSSVECVGNSSSTIDIEGFIPVGVTGYVYYRVSGQFTYTLFGIFTSEDLSSGQTITGLICEENYQIRILALSNNCDYGFGEIANCGTGLC